MPRPKTLTLAPAALDRNGLSASQTLATSNLEFILGGALSAGLDRNGIAASQTPLAGGNLTLDGALGTVFPAGVRVSVYAAADDTGRTFTVTGTQKNGDVLIEDITGPNIYTVFSNALFYSITSVAVDAATAGAIEIGVQGTATFTTPQHITIYSAADDTGRTFTIVGTSRNGQPLTEDVTGANAGTALGVKNFATVSQVTADAAPAGAAEVGVDGLCESTWYQLNRNTQDFNVGIALNLVSGAATFAVQQTFENYQENGKAEDAVAKFTHASLTGKTADAFGSIIAPCFAARLAITAFTSGSVEMQIVQS